MKNKEMTKDTILEFYKKGFTLAEIARYYQVSRSTIYYTISEDRQKKVKENTKRNYIKNREKIRAQQKEYYKKRKEAKLWKLL